MNKNTDRMALLSAKIKKIENFKIFNKKETKIQDDFSCTLSTFSTVALITTGIGEIEKIFQNYCNFKIFETKTKRTYYILNLPQNPHFKEDYLNHLKKLKIKSFFSLDLNYRENLFLYPLNSAYKALNWEKKRENIILELREIDSISYNFPTFPTFPLFITKNELEKSSSRDFIEKYSSQTNKDFIINAIERHILAQTRIFEQERILSISFKKEDLKELKKYSNSFKTSFSENLLNSFRNSFTQKQRIEIPLIILKDCFKSENLTREGLKFFLLVFFSYHASARIFNYKPSTIIALADINEKKGITYTISTMKKYFSYFQKINLISEIPEITKEVIKKDKTIKLKLNPLQELKFY